MESNNLFAKAEGVRTQLSDEQEKKIQKMYSDLSSDIAKEAKSLSGKTNVSSVMRASYLKDLRSQVSSQLASYSSDQKSMIKDNMLQVAQAVVADNSKYLSSIGLNVSGAFSYVPKDVVEQLASGKMYEGKWSLSTAIWGNDKKVLSDIDMIIAKGVAGQKSTYDIAKELEKYVNPSKAKQWDWGKVYPGSSRKIDYNAQRLARTMVSHAYQESFVRTTKNNPFIEAYNWLSSGDDRVCPLCIERAEGNHGVYLNGVSISGAYYKDDLPMDHPNGRCTFDIISGTSDAEDNARAAAWIKGGDDEELDAYARSMGYTPEIVKSSANMDKIMSNMTPYQQHVQQFYDKYGPIGKGEDYFKFSQANPEASKELYALAKEAGYGSSPSAYFAKVKGADIAKVSKLDTEMQASKQAKTFVKNFGKSSQSFEQWMGTASMDQVQSLTKISDTYGKGLEQAYTKFVYDSKAAKAEAKVAANEALQSYVGKFGKSTLKYDDYMKGLSAAQKDELISLAGSKNPSKMEAYYNLNVQQAGTDYGKLLVKCQSQTIEKELALESKSLAKLSKQEVAGIREYTGSSYKQMNGYLRAIASGKSEEQAMAISGMDDKTKAKLVDAMNGADKFVLTKDTVLRRGTTIGDLADFLPGNDFESKKAALSRMDVAELNQKFSGAISSSSGFTSTSSIWGRGYDGTVEIIYNAPAGTKVSSIMGASYYGTTEGESLIAPGVKKQITRIEGSDGHAGSKIRVFMDLLAD